MDWLGISYHGWFHSASLGKTRQADCIAWRTHVILPLFQEDVRIRKISWVSSVCHPTLARNENLSPQFISRSPCHPKELIFSWSKMLGGCMCMHFRWHDFCAKTPIHSNPNSGTTHPSTTSTSQNEIRPVCMFLNGSAFVTPIPQKENYLHHPNAFSTCMLHGWVTCHQFAQCGPNKNGQDYVLLMHSPPVTNVALGGLSYFPQVNVLGLASPWHIVISNPCKFQFMITSKKTFPAWKRLRRLFWYILPFNFSRFQNPHSHSHIVRQYYSWSSVQ